MMHTSFWWVSPPDISFVLQFFKFAHISLEGFIPSLHFSSLNWGGNWWCLFQELTCFALMHFSGQRSIEQVAPATTELQLTHQGRSTLLLAFAAHPQSCCAHFLPSLRGFWFHFWVLPHFLQHRAFIFVSSWAKSHICRDAVKQGGCAEPVAAAPSLAEHPWQHCHILWDIPVLGLAGRAGWAQESAESCWSLHSPQSLPLVKC